MSKIIQLEIIEQKIFIIREMKVMLSFHLAELYEVEPKVLMQSVKRNQDRFPDDFMFQLTWDETNSLRSQIVTLKDHSGSKRGAHLKFLPYAFSELGIAMLSSVLRSKRAIHINITIMRTFVRLREVLATHKDLAQRLAELEQRMGRKDNEILALFEAIRKLMAPPPEKKKKPIGFIVDRE